ncbi:hypothetical protein AAVH_12988 [Aphelenchoides avenae]|nr:hypothetical protein AAVH_12988 [Aphelenchus avenae]
MDITFFGIDFRHAVEAHIESLAKECTTHQRRRQDLELFAPSTFGYLYGSATWDHLDLEYFEEWYERTADPEIKRLRAEETKLLMEIEQAHAHRVLVYRMLRVGPKIDALRGVLRRRVKSALSRLAAENIRDIGQCLDLNTRISLCRFLFDICMAR